MKRLEIWVVPITLVLFATWVVWAMSWSEREASRWSACLGKPLETCAIPEGYDAVQERCSSGMPCDPTPPGMKRVTAGLSTAPQLRWSSYAYAVITLDAEGRISSVEVKRVYASL